MNDSIIDLGNSLAGEYHNKMTQWSEVEFTFTGDDLAASLGLADDIVRVEEGGEAFSELFQTLQTDFLPEDLLADSVATAPPPEQQPLHRRFVRKAIDYPFTSPEETGFTGLSADLPPGAEQPVQAESKVAGNTDLPASDSVSDFPDSILTSTPGSKNGDSNPGEEPNDSNLPEPKARSTPHTKNKAAAVEYAENSIKPIAGNDPAASDTKIIKIPPGDIVEPVRNPHIPGLDKISSPMVETSPASVQEQPIQTDTPPGRIWTQPLQNLGDFATLFVDPIEKSGKPKPPGPSQIPLPGTNPEFIELNKEAENESALVPENLLRPGTSNLNSEMAPVPELPEYFSTGPQASYFKSQTQLFEQEINRNLPDTDDLLEALTERILRDFHRYYP